MRSSIECKKAVELSSKLGKEGSNLHKLLVKNYNDALESELMLMDKAAIEVINANVTVSLLEEVNTATAQLNDDYLVTMQNWIVATAKRLKEFKEGNRPLSRSNTTEYYDQLFAIAGGKTWYTVINGNSNEALLAIADKHCKQVIAKRNQAITKKLAGLQVTEINTISSVYGQTGFEGTFKIVTNKGVKIVDIKIIVAGGYNIQCIHNRTLVTVR